ncbi:prefoldin subunit, putative [Entamoeba dispar SAW760]|uniref:Prefoldin subunit, putative n=1 Tax=Entamoeba dispar (strain ATCC PRA-260 / SAW760) TaxID=370354 RepID=B0EMI8_ENTDS|nr:prefoldin subunit, putative [Entamoeba dispar SAW760]EDR24234.1 prefoldin subunit, putative [Entamoeba dispar SAW760]|eukprot:EDR24234.1 prefoldin subunit, putative [Entamoeba dispar SAW760]
MKCIGNSIKLEQMDRYELSALNQQLVADIDWINANIKRVTADLEDYNEKTSILNTLKCPNTIPTDAFVPLTQTLMIKGDIEFNGRVIVHVGDQYYVSKKVDKAIEFYTKRINEKQMEKNAYEILLRDRQSVLSKMEQLVKRMIELQNLLKK